MKIKNGLLLGILVSIVVIAGIASASMKISHRQIQVVSRPIQDKSDLIRVSNIIPNQKIQSPLNIAGEARGFWFFEATFLIKILDANGHIIGETLAQAKNDWMTNDFVPFEARVNFEIPTTKTGILVLEKDNPSGLPENGDELRIPIDF